MDRPVETLELYRNLSDEQREALIVRRRTKAWVSSMGFSDKYDRTQMAMAEMLRDQAAAVPSVLVDHPAPAPRYTGETVSKSLSRGLQDADTMEK